MQAIRFLGISGLGWVLDFSTFIGLGNISDNLTLNNIISSWIGVTFVFLFATKKVFKTRSRIPLRWKYLLYLLYQAALIFLISVLLQWLNQVIVNKIVIENITRYSSIVAKILVTPVTMVLNFLVMKGIIERI